MKRAWLVVACLVVTTPWAAADSDFDALLDTLAAQWMSENPQAATISQYFERGRQDELDRQLTPVSMAYRQARVARARQALDLIGRFDAQSLSAAQRVSLAMARWQLNEIVDSERFFDYAYPLQQFSGIQVNLVNFLSSAHPLRNPRDVENYLARLAQVDGILDEATSQARERGERGILPPKFILKSTIDQIGRFLEPPAADNALVKSLADRSARIGDLAADARGKAVGEAASLVETRVLPAFRRAKALLEEQLPRASDDAGLWRFGDGAEAYAAALRRSTTTGLSADEIHELGLKEVARIEQAMDVLLKRLDYSSGSVKERMARLEADLQPKEADPRPKILDDFAAMVRDAQRRSEQLFDLRPKAPCEVRREPPFTEKNAAAHYTPPAPDGSLPGIFWAPLPGPPYEMTGMRTLTYHEAVPGHHFQIALQREMADLPRFRRDFVFGGITAHAEGWALYAEQLAAESGWYEGDVPGLLGQLDAELFRARRLVVDTGLHARRWTRQQAIDYGIPASEVERYVVMPGQACAYKIGQLRILALRAQMKDALGDRFSLREFHNLVLRTGGVPLDVLQGVVEEEVRARGR